MPVKDSYIDQQQEDVLALRLPQLMSPKFSPEKYKTIFRAGVDAAQVDLRKMSENFNSPEVQEFIDNSSDTIGDKLQGIVEHGYLLKNPPRDVKLSSKEMKIATDMRMGFINSLVQSLNREISIAHKEAEKLTVIENITQQTEKNANVKEDIDQEMQGKSWEEKKQRYMEMVNFFDELESSLDPALRSNVNKSFYDSALQGLNTLRGNLLITVKCNLIKEDPQKYLMFTKERLAKKLTQYIHNPTLLVDTLENFAVQAESFLVEVQQEKDDAIVKEKLIAFETNFEEEAPFDFIPVAGTDKTYICEYVPPAQQQNYEKSRQHAEKTVELYESFLNENKWKNQFGMVETGTSIEFLNGVISFEEKYQRDDFSITLRALVDGYSINVERNTEAFEFATFKQAFEHWKQQNDNTSGFQYGDPPKSFDASAYLQYMKKTDITLDVLQREPSEEFKHFMDSRFGTEINNIIYTKREGKFRERKSSTITTTMEDPYRTKVETHEADEEQNFLVTIKTTEEYFEDESHQIKTKKRVHETHVENQKLLEKMLTTFDNGVMTESSLFLYDENGKIKNRFLTYYKDGLEDTIFEWDDKGELSKKTSVKHQFQDGVETKREFASYNKEGNIISATRIYFIDGKEFAESTDEYDNDFKIIRRTSYISGIHSVAAIDYAAGNELQDGDEKTPPNYTRSIEVTDAQGNTFILKSYEEMKKDNPDFTPWDYYDFLQKTFPDDETTYALGELAFTYVYDSSNPEDPLEKGTEKEHGDYWQTPEETLVRREKGTWLIDCDDKAFFFDAKNKAAGRISYVVYMPHHAENIVIDLDQNGFWHASSYGTFGVDRDGNRIGEPFDPEKAKGYPTLEEALKSINEKWERADLGKGIFYLGEDKVLVNDVHLPLDKRGSDLSHEKVGFFSDKHKGWSRTLTLKEIEDEVMNK